MNFLLANSFFNSSWFLVIILVVAVGLLLLTSFTRRKKEEQYRNDLNEKLVKGTKVRTIGGIYGTIVSVRNTTDGKIILLETGEGDKKSYANFHVNAILDVATEEDVVVDKDGNEIPLSEYQKQQEEAAKQPEEKVEETTEQPTKVTNEENAKNEEEPVEEVKTKTKKNKKND